VGGELVRLRENLGVNLVVVDAEASFFRRLRWPGRDKRKK
jgi:hypothetical protein